MKVTFTRCKQALFRTAWTRFKGLSNICDVQLWTVNVFKSSFKAGLVSVEIQLTVICTKSGQVSRSVKTTNLTSIKRDKKNWRCWQVVRKRAPKTAVTLKHGTSQIFKSKWHFTMFWTSKTIQKYWLSQILFYYKRNWDIKHTCLHGYCHSQVQSKQ